MKTKDQYEVSHKAAKAVVCAVVIFLLLLARYYDTMIFDAAAVIIWFFGVNPIGYFIESVLHFKHKHNIL